MATDRNPILDSVRIIPREQEFLDRKVGSRGEIFYDREDNALRLFDGVEPGGFALLRADLTNVEGVIGAQPSAGVPAIAQIGAMWFNTTNGRLFVYYNDGNSNQWVQPTSSFYNQQGTPSALAFPSSPTVGQTVTNGVDTWEWSGTYWGIKNQTTLSLTGLTVSNVIDGQVDDISNHALNDLSDVGATAGAANGDVLAYNTAQQQWLPLTLSSTFNGGTISNPLIVNNNTASTSTVTGAIRVTGGVGIGDALFVGTSINARFRGELRLWDNDNTQYLSLRAPTNVTSNVTWTLPASDGTIGQVLTTNGSGTLSWATVTGGGGGGGASNPPGGSDGNIQFNNNGSFGGTANLVWDDATDTLGTFELYVNSTTTSTSPTTGAVIVDGGVGIGGRLNVGGQTKVTATTASTSTTTGAFVVSGGAAVAGTVYVGGDVNIATSPTDPHHAANKSYVDSKALAFSMAFGV